MLLLKYSLLEVHY